jgi:polysaccharide deacetylase family protein (PEP-CTERM system associated)
MVAAGSGRQSADHLSRQKKSFKPVINALSVDVEDYFQVSAFNGLVNRSDWDQLEPRVDANTRRLLDLFDKHEVKATFFFLGWIAERHADLVRAVHESGHEVASHGYDHRQITTMSKEEFRRDLRRSKEILEGITGEALLGYRAPSFSVTRATIWALDILSEEDFAYDSSIFPIRHDRYGIHDSPRFPWQRTGSCGSVLHEFPMSTVRVLRWNLPFVGGGYLRQFPFPFVEWGMKRVNRSDSHPVVVYVHPWEVDPEQPRMTAGFLTTIRHYRNLDKTETRLGRLLQKFEFAPMKDVLGL